MEVPKYLEKATIDDLARMIEGLVEELWVTKDRLFVLEEVLAGKGTLSDSTVDEHLPSEPLQAVLRRERMRLIQRVLGAPQMDH
ncbi:hypothetical protein AB0J72_13125 [Dactylosporangium sp. NPDC049742]|uniref:hypothetical protein n=1 Tax=unclassified Dactylosporangium TaxID=2621675 RepID=UPI003440ABF4